MVRRPTWASGVNCSQSCPGRNSTEGMAALASILPEAQANCPSHLRAQFQTDTTAGKTPPPHA